MMNEPQSTKKSLGQHWLHDQKTLHAIAAEAQITPKDTVLEIGPGLGTLTKLLTESAQRVIAVEVDETLAHKLPERVPAANLEVIQQDILRFDFSTLPEGFKIVANIPYYLTSNLIRVLSESLNSPVVAVLLIQKEVAERLTAKPGAMSILSVTAQFYWQVERGIIVPASLFTPPPKVDSQVVILQKPKKQAYGSVDTAMFFRLVKAGFSQRRKTLLNSLSAGLRISKDDVKDLCQRAKIDAGRRAQTLSLDEWYALYSVFTK